MLRLQSRYSLTDSSTIMNNNYRECYRKSNTKQRRILWTRVRVCHLDFKNDTSVICNLDIEMHLDFGIVLISTRLWTRASFHQCMVLWFYSFMHVFFFTGCRAARPWTRDYNMPVWHGSGRLHWDDFTCYFLVTSSSRCLNDSPLVSGRNISAVSSVGTGWSLKVSQVQKENRLYSDSIF